jgi:putative tryptophan/tyrosine transport system substrate-binding protein
MRRRDFIKVIGGTAAGWSRAATAQQPASTRRISVLMGPMESDPDAQLEIATFRQSLQKLGWTGGKVRIAYRWGAGDVARMRIFARELMALQPDAALASTTPALAALVAETRSVPIVFVRVSDPVGDGFVDSLATPHGNVTGFSNIGTFLAGKWVQLLKQIKPDLTRATVMFNPATSPGGGLHFLRVAEAAGLSLGIEVSAAHVNDASGIEHVIAAIGRERSGGLISLPDVFLSVHRPLIIELTAQHRVPAIYQYRYFTASGGLLSYGTVALDQYSKAAEYIHRIFNGAKLSDLPVQQSERFELVINLNTAKALGLDVPLQLQQLADEVIE